MHPANLLCPVCFKAFIVDTWLDKHIEKEHPTYSADAISRKRELAEPRGERPSKHHDRPSSRTFFRNHDHIYDTATFNDGDEITILSNPQPSDPGHPTIHAYPDAGLPCAYVPQEKEYELSRTLYDSYAPFTSEEEFNFAELVTTKHLSGSVVDSMLKGNCGLNADIRNALKSNYHLRQKIDQMGDGLGVKSWRKAYLQGITWNEQHPDEPIEFWYRDLIECTKWLLRQPAYEEHLSYAPQRQFDDQGRRIYGEMYTADWWWERQTLLDTGDTVIPIIFMSDATHLTNFSGDKKAWPVYMTIGNLSASVRMAPTMHSVLLVALLPIPVKMRDIPLSRYNIQKERNRIVMQYVLRHVMGPLTKNRNNRLFYAQCADGHIRHCVASPAAWIADYPEHRDLHNMKNGVCYWCECPQPEMGEFPAQPYPPRDHEAYRTLSIVNTPAAKARLAHVGMHQGSNFFWDVDCVLSDLPKPDLLHTMQLGMLKHLLGWLSGFLKQHKRLETFNNIWLSVPAYLEMSKPRRAYEEVSSWQGKEIKTMSRFLVAVLRSALRSPSPSQRRIFDQAIQCTRALVEFYFYCQYESHDEETLSLMDNALHCFHNSKNIFCQFRAGKKVSEESKVLQKTLHADRDKELESIISATHRDRTRKEWNDFIQQELIEHREDGADFNFPKIHQMLHFREQIQRYGYLKQWSTEIGESSHRMQIKDGYNASNRTGDFFSQIIEYYQRSDAFAIRKLNSLAMERKKDSSTSGKHHSPSQVIASFALGPKFISPQKGSGAGKIITFASLLQSVSDKQLRKHLHHATVRFLLSKKININFNDLLNCTAGVFHGIEVSTTDSMTGNQVIQRIRCTGEDSWYSGPPRLDWVWVKTSHLRQGQEPPYKALRGRLPYHLLKLFKLQILPHDVFWCAFVETTIPSTGGMPEKASGMVKVTKPPMGTGYEVISGGNITGAAHLIPEEPVSSPIANKAWIVNNHIDLDTWNNVYYLLESELSQATKGVGC